MNQSPRECRVLCVDDHPDIRKSLAMVLDAEDDMQCVGCLASADHLVQEVERLSPDVVLLDATMRGKNPFDAIRELTAAHPKVKTIVFTGHADADVFRNAKNAGACECVSKGVDPSALLDVIRQACGLADLNAAPRAVL